MLSLKMRKIIAIVVAVIMIAAMSVSVNAVGGRFNIDPTNPNSAIVRTSLALGSTSAEAETSMDYGFCTLNTDVKCYFYIGNQLTYNREYGTPTVSYSASTTAYTTAGASSVGAVSFHSASSPDGSLSNSGPLSVGVTS